MIDWIGRIVFTDDIEVAAKRYGFIMGLLTGIGISSIIIAAFHIYAHITLMQNV